MHKPKSSRPSRRQQGAATIFITIVLLLAVGLIALYANRGAILEQRLAANEVRAKQAFAAANAGLDAALARWHESGIALVLPPGVPSVHTPGVVTLRKAAGDRETYYQFRYCDSTPPNLPNCPAIQGGAWSGACNVPPSPVQIRVVSCGWSDDNTSVQRVSQIIGPSRSLPGPVSAPLIARGAANVLTGGASIMNFHNDLTVWTGQTLVGQANNGRTFVRDIVMFPNPYAPAANPPNYDFRAAVNNSPACNNVPVGYDCSTQGPTIGHDTVTGDTNLSSFATAPDFFEFIFGSRPDAYKNATAEKIVAATDVGTVATLPQTTIWIEGDTDLNGSVIGAVGDSKILIINGNLTLRGNVVIHGLVFVMGTVTSSGNPKIFGSLVTAGNANITGNLTILYDPLALNQLPKAGKAAKVPGTWRDW